jgi:hypothetical protein
MRPG